MIAENDATLLGQHIDNTAFMLYDLERGGHIQNPSVGLVIGRYSVSYERIELSSTVLNANFIQTVNDFVIKIVDGQTVVAAFSILGQQERIDITGLDGLHPFFLFVEELFEFRKRKFSINT